MPGILPSSSFADSLGVLEPTGDPVDRVRQYLLGARAGQATQLAAPGPERCERSDRVLCDLFVTN
jgi:hypothetical protein